MALVSAWYRPMASWATGTSDTPTRSGMISQRSTRFAVQESAGGGGLGSGMSRRMNRAGRRKSRAPSRGIQMSESENPNASMSTPSGSHSSFSVGNIVEACWHNQGKPMRATVVKRSGNNLYDVKFFNGGMVERQVCWDVPVMGRCCVGRSVGRSVARSLVRPFGRSLARLVTRHTHPAPCHHVPLRAATCRHVPQVHASNMVFVAFSDDDLANEPSSPSSPTLSGSTSDDGLGRPHLTSSDSQSSVRFAGNRCKSCVVSCVSCVVRRASCVVRRARCVTSRQ